MEFKERKGSYVEDGNSVAPSSALRDPVSGMARVFQNWRIIQVSTSG